METEADRAALREQAKALIAARDAGDTEAWGKAPANVRFLAGSIVAGQRRQA